MLRVQGLGLRVQDCKGAGLGFMKMQDKGFKVQCSALRICSSRQGVRCLRLRLLVWGC